MKIHTLGLLLQRQCASHSPSKRERRKKNTFNVDVRINFKRENKKFLVNCREFLVCCDIHIVKIIQFDKFLSGNGEKIDVKIFKSCFDIFITFYIACENVNQRATTVASGKLIANDEEEISWWCSNWKWCEMINWKWLVGNRFGWHTENSCFAGFLSWNFAINKQTW